MIELVVGLIELGIGPIELGIGLIELGIGAPSWPVYPALFSFCFGSFARPPGEQVCAYVAGR